MGEALLTSDRPQPGWAGQRSHMRKTWLRRRTRALAAALSVGAFVVAPAVFYGAAFVLTRRDIGFDLRYAYLPAGRDVVHGMSPYASSAESLIHQTAYVYPPLLAVLASPLTALPIEVASLLAAILFTCAIPTILYLLRVRDWRCYGLALMWAPVFNAVDNVNVSLLLALGLALAWRYRHRPIASAVALGIGVALKIFAWPLLLWQLANRRLRAGAGSIAVAVSAVMLPWAALGFDGLSGYPSLLRRLTTLEQDDSYSLHAALTAVGAPASVARALVLLVVAGLIALVVVLGRKGLDLPSFTCAIAAALAASPIVWQHYLVLLLVPLAIARPTLSIAWFAPLALWASNLRGDNGRLWQTLLVPGVAALLVVVCCRPRHASAERPIALRTREGLPWS